MKFMKSDKVFFNTFFQMNYPHHAVGRKSITIFNILFKHVLQNVVYQNSFFYPLEGTRIIGIGLG